MVSLKNLPLIGLRNQFSFIKYFSVINAKLRYQGTYIGFLWAGLEPLLAFVILYIVFSTIRITTHEDFPVYLFSGLIFFQIFTRGTANGLSSLRGHANIIKSININKELFPVTSTGSTLIILVIQISIFFMLLPFLDFIPHWTIILLLLPILLIIILVLGLSYVLSVAHVYFRDISPIWTTFSYALFFVTPIFWYVKDVGGILVMINEINPLGRIIEIVHGIVFNEIPSLEYIAITFLYVLSIFFIGYYIFQRFEKNVAEAF